MAIYMGFGKRNMQPEYWDREKEMCGRKARSFLSLHLQIFRHRPTLKCITRIGNWEEIRTAEAEA